MMIAPVGLLLLVGAVLLVWWLAKHAPGWVVALLGGGTVLMGGVAALLMLSYARTESRLVQVQGAQSATDEVIELSEAEEARLHVHATGSAAEAKPLAIESSEAAPHEDWPYRGRHPADDGPHRAATWNLAIGGLLLIVVVGVGLLVGFVALCIYLFKKHPALIVLPIFGGLGLAVVILGFAWVAVDSPSIVYSEPSKLSASAEPDLAEPPLMNDRHVLHAPSPGTVKEIFVLDQAHVDKDDVLLRLENKLLQTSHDKILTAIVDIDEQLKDAGDEAKKTELEKTRSAQQALLDDIDEQIAQLEIKSPITGHVDAPNLSGLLNQAVKAGDVLLHISETAPPADIAVEGADSAPKPPEWTESLKLSRIDGVDRQTVVIGPHLNLDRHDDELYQEIHAVMRTYVEGLPGVDSAQHFRVPVDYINDNIIRAEYIETHDYSVGRMKRKFVLLQFDHRVKKEIEEMYRDKLLENRLGFAAVGSCLLLMLIGTVYGYLKLDTQTKGYYTGRLKLAAAAVIMLVVALAAMLSRGAIIG